MDWLGLENKAVLVTGAASGIGKAVSEGLLESGANVIACDINKEKPEFNFENEWIFKADTNNIIKEMYVGSSEEGIILKGISYWTKKDGKYISKKIEDAVNNNGFDNLYWDEIVIENISNIEIELKVLKDDDVFEIDSINDLRKVEDILLKSNLN